MASGIARGHVCTMTVTTATESHNMAAILCSIDMQPWFSMYFSNIGHPCYDQLTPVKTRYPLTSIMWLYRRLKFTAHRGQVLVFNWIARSGLVNLLKIAQDCSEAG